MIAQVKPAIATPAPAIAPLKTVESIDPVFRQIRDLVYRVSGIFQVEEKLYLLVDGCRRRMKMLNITSPRAYAEMLTNSPTRQGELRELLNQVTIGETCLFRSQPQLDALRKVILPELVGERTRQITKRLRIWSAGCSTGEESYTLAINILEESEKLLKGWTVEIHASDLNDNSVATAKAGIYGDYALRHTPDIYKQKYFLPTPEQKLQVKPEVKKLVSFSRLNLTDDSRMVLMKGMDLIFCCNVLIYFDDPSKGRVVDHFFANLNFGGYFFLGTSESLMRLNSQFHLVHFPSAISYWKPSLKSAKP